jgi:polyisoprenoid-binding protein YceI
VAGRFAQVDGTFSFDPENVTSSKASATIAAKSIDTQQAKRDKHLRSPDFFDTDKYPEIKFISKEITDVNGVTHPVVLEAEFNGATKDPWGNERAAFTAESTVNRKSWGLAWSKVLETGGLVVGDEVKIVLEIEGIVKKA